MADSGATLGADLGDLYNAGKYGLPAVAQELSAAANDIPTPAFQWFDRAAYDVGMGWYGPYDDITAYSAELASILSTSADNIDETGATLVYIADHYQGVDSAALTEFNKRKQQLATVPSVRQGHQ